MIEWTFILIGYHFKCLNSDFYFLDFVKNENVMQCNFNRNSFWNLCRFLWMHRRKVLPFDYICIQAMRNVQYTAVSQQIRLLIEGLLSGSQQGLMDRGQSPIKLSKSNSLSSLTFCCSPQYNLLLFLTHINHYSVRSWTSTQELSHTLHLLVNDSSGETLALCDIACKRMNVKSM